MNGIRPYISGGSSDQSTSLDAFPIWTPIIEAELRKLQIRPVYIIWESLFQVGTIQTPDFSLGFIFCLVLFGR
jgi:hypothetical protein